MEEITDVLISGSGPAGLMAACQLADQGISFRIIDKGKAFSNLSRALAVQARTLEIFQQMGIADKAIRQGEKVRGILLLTKNGLAKGELGLVGNSITPFPFILILPQDRTERLLAKRLNELGSNIEWESELLSIKQNSENITALVRTSNGDREIKAKYLIGADGAHSATRHALGIDFVGDAYEHTFYLADLSVSWDLPRGYAVVSPGATDFNGFFPMPGESHYRILGIIPEELRDSMVDLKLVQTILKEKVPISLQVSDPRWLSQYKLHHRCAKYLRKGRGFLCGDAGHIHSPAGGQGMNTGLQDAHNLAWKLSFVLKYKVSEKILDSYERERLPFARRLVKGTDAIFSTATGKSIFARFFRTRLLPRLMPILFSFQKIRLLIFQSISQTQISYKESYLSRIVLSPLSGKRLPHANLTSGNSILNEMDSKTFHLIFLMQNSPEFDFSSGEIPLKVHHFIPEIERDLCEATGMKSGMILVRPDQYVSFSSETISIDLLNRYFSALYES
ncbi:FAD binding domain protein [Leptospira inadai serovar Lyme str. 10]|uniref:FAD binding domain protein n=2 Tax=Leptospira inadai serovar Lyme TaxID=293084 RepID=V6HD09_9LEPT|nr:FAD-dependent monooxygenase [Leptospira inadai]EQA36853.1 FAD binding domain protein [Leptospira inadai serovar Lyme str. 10]PNV75524.1 FAD-binding protein [Leptospira inadai serovar Lyme]